MTQRHKITHKLYGKSQGLRHLIKGFSKYVYLHSRGKLVRMPIQQLKDEFAFSFAPGGWNYFNSIVDDWVSLKGEATAEQSLFWAFFNSSRVRSVKTLNDLLFLHDPKKQNESPTFYLGTYPWGGITKEDTKNGGIPFGWYHDSTEGKNTKYIWGSGRTLWYQPGDDHTLKTEWNYTIDVFKKLQNGYHPLRYMDYPSVALLIRKDGKQLGLNIDGHHRLGVLGHLNYQHVRVEVKEVVKESEVETWYYVKNGYCTKKQALVIFHAFFDLDGSERILALNLAAKGNLYHHS